MLNLETRQEILGVTVFQDTDEPTRFYYLPEAPHITYEGGSPLFDLYNYRKGGEAEDAFAGGFLNMTVDLDIGGLKNRIKERLAQRYGEEVTLAAVPFTKGKTRVIALGEDSDALKGGVADEAAPSGQPLVTKGPRFIQNILGAATPSLDGANRAIFSFSLSEDGAAFFSSIFNGSAQTRPVGVVYELEYVGLLPAYDLEITINFKSVYDYMRSRFTLGTLFFKADLDNIIEQLQRQQSITIKDTSRTLELSTPEAVQARQARIDRLVKDLATGALFAPSLTPGEPKVKGETMTAADPTSSAPATGLSSSAGRALREGPSAALVAGMAEAFNVGASRSGGNNSGSNAAGGNNNNNPNNPGGNSGNSNNSERRNTTATDLWNRLGRPQAAYVLKNIRQEEERTITYNLSQVTAQKQSVAPQSFIQFLADPRQLDQHIHIVDLNHPFFQKINININALDVDFAEEGIVQMLVQLRYGTRPDGSGPKDTAEVILRSREDSKDLSFFADHQQTQSYEYKLIVDYQNGFGIGLSAARLETEWLPSEARSLAVHPRWLNKTLPVKLQLAPNLAADVTEVQVQVRYQNLTTNIDDATLISLTPQKPEEMVYIRLADETEQFQILPTIYYQDGTKEERPLVSLPNPDSGLPAEVVVISLPPSQNFMADLVMLDPLDQLQSVWVDTKIFQEDNLLSSVTKELTVPGKRAVLSLRLTRPNIPARLHFKERRLYKDGGLEEGEWQEAISPNLTLGIPAEGTMTVSARYMGPPPSTLNLNGIILDLEYHAPDGDPEFYQQNSFLITDDPASFTGDWRFRLAEREKREYQWRLTLLNTDGSESSTEFTKDQRKLLVLRLPPL